MPAAHMCLLLLSAPSVESGCPQALRPVQQLDYAGVVGFVLVLFLTVRAAGAAVQRISSQSACQKIMCGNNLVTDTLTLCRAGSRCSVSFAVSQRWEFRMAYPQAALGQQVRL